MRPYGLFDVAAVTLANSLALFRYIDEISEKLDFIGINYYGQVCFINLDSAPWMIPNLYSHAHSNICFRKQFRVLALSWSKMTSTVNLVVRYILTAYIACCFSTMKDTSI